MKAIVPGCDTFKEINRLTGRKRLGKIEKVFDGKNDVIVKKEDIVKVFAKYFSQNFEDKEPKQDPSFSSEITEAVRTFKADNTITDGQTFKPLCKFGVDNPSDSPIDMDKFINFDYLWFLIKSLNNKKSYGNDLISNFIIKKCHDPMIYVLVILFNNCINNSYFPSSWKISRLIPLPKKSDAVKAADFRPISLLSNYGKLFEKVIVHKVNEACYESNEKLIPNWQFGFRPKHSTVDALLKFHNDVTLHLNKDMSTAACLLDVQKAFDSVWWNGLLYKLIFTHKLDKYLCSLITSFLQDRYFYVEVLESVSNKCKVESGVPQGSILGPILYSLYTADQPQDTDSMTLLYADDSITYSSSRCPELATLKVQKHLDKLQRYYEKWGITINENKTEFIIIRPPNLPNRYAKKIKSATINIKGKPIRPIDKVKYLGVTVIKNFGFNKHILNSVKKVGMTYGMIGPVMRGQKLQKQTKLLLYKQLIRPIITYGFPIWFTASPTYYTKL